MSVSTSGDDTGSLGNAYPRINIIGAGVAGLSLACHLRRRRIPFDIFDAASKPKGHHYGITISQWAYGDLLTVTDPKLNIQTFRDLTAVDRLVGGHGITTADATNRDGKGNGIASDLRASDIKLREVLARGHQVKWNHKVVSAESVAGGLKLSFDNGNDSTANITIDAGGERSGLMAVLLPELKPDVLPYAVYHGSRYIAQSTFNDRYSDIFHHGENVRYLAPQAASSSSSSHSPWHLQIAKSYITQDQVPSKIKLADTHGDDEPVVEIRYTFSRPAQQSHDPIFNPGRAKDEATQIPPAFFDEISTFLTTAAQPSSALPPSLVDLLDPSRLRQDRILNWLMRLRPRALERQRLRALASKGVIAIGDSIHATPPLGSQGADVAMDDAACVAAWIGGQLERKDAAVGADGEDVMQFYEQRSAAWDKVVEDARLRLETMHAVDGGGDQGLRLSGRI